MDNASSRFFINGLRIVDNHSFCGSLKYVTRACALHGEWHGSIIASLSILLISVIMKCLLSFVSNFDFMATGLH